MLYPLKFKPIFKERIWGGRELERLFHKPLPPQQKIGESWELVDRAEDCSVIANGSHAGKTLRWLMEHHAQEILGENSPPLQTSNTSFYSPTAPQTSALNTQHFPILVKWLDARDLLSVQVHPPAAVAAKLGGEPKTEMWWIADAAPDAVIYFGLKRGATRAKFADAIQAGNVADLLHKVAAKRGDIFFIPSGRVHALGAGMVLLEIQQNSDTTYRVFDWNRTDASGKPRDLHIEQALQSIDFTDYEPNPAGRFCEAAQSPTADSQSRPPSQSSPPVTCEHFTVHHICLAAPRTDRCDGTTFQILCQLSGSSLIANRAIPPHERFEETLNAGEITLLPAAFGDYRIEPTRKPCELIKVTAP
jgi:mannose-6-phosphate isomerase